MSPSNIAQALGDAQKQALEALSIIDTRTDDMAQEETKPGLMKIEVYRLAEGGFVAGIVTEGEVRPPAFACTTIAELTDYIARNLDPEGYASRAADSAQKWDVCTPSFLTGGTSPPAPLDQAWVPQRKQKD